MKKNIPLILFLALIVLFSLSGIIADLNSSKNKENINPDWKTIRPPHEVSKIIIYKDYLYAGGQDGVYKIDLSTGSVIEKLNPSEKMEYVRSMAIDSKGILWIGHDNGVTLYNGESYKTFKKSDGLPDNRVNALLKDSKDRMWVGTWEGVAVFENEKCSIITEKDGLINNMVNVILEDKDHGMWFGSYVAPKGGVSYYKDDKWQYFNVDNGLLHNNVTSILQYSDGSIWVGTGLYEEGGASEFIFKDGSYCLKHTYSKKDNLAGEKVRSLYEDSQGNLWIGSEYDGVAIWNKENKRIITTEDGLCNQEVKSVLQDKNGVIWIGTRDGITRIEKLKIES